jgi:hypothetical protein
MRALPRWTESITADHVVPDSWYPDTTPPNVQRWTVPSCAECNRALGQLEKDLLIRLILCVDPKSEAASGLAAKAFRSLGFDTDELSEQEKSHRERFRAKIRSELIPSDELSGKPGAIPGLGSPEGQSGQWSIPIPWAAFSIIAEKIVRGCEYKLKDRFVEPPYGIRTFVSESGIVPEPYASYSKSYDFGPGCNVQRVFATEDPNVVLYWVTVWGTLYFTVRIDLEDDLCTLDQRSRKIEGIDPQELRAGMRIPSYLLRLPKTPGRSDK